jgi:acetylornithine deacetylase/succinyl-diaminopimelate desuccinylase-like protein
LTDANLTGEATELLQQLIRNACVNDGTPESGQEVRNADVLRSYLEGAGIDAESYEPTPGRVSLVARIEGSDPSAPTVCWCGHTDVVPVTPAGWRRDPFGGELVTDDRGERELWGRGAVDMLNITATMAVAFRSLAARGWRPRGTLIYFAVADEEAGGRHGAEWMVDNRWDAVGADYVLTESGGLVLPSRGTTRVSMTASEKGIAWRRLRVRGTPGHGSMPFGADNALVKAAEVVRRLAAFRPKASVSDHWRAWVEALDVDDELRAALVDPARVWDACDRLGDPMLAKVAHACTHMTFSPNVVHGGVKTNVIPDVVDVDVDVRTLPGETGEDVAANLREALGDLADHVEVSVLQDGLSTSSPLGTPMWDALQGAVRKAYPEATLVPRLTTGGTDARFYREKGTVAYGAALFSRTVTPGEFATRFHGHDERVDVDSLGLTTQLWLDVAEQVNG